MTPAHTRRLDNYLVHTDRCRSRSREDRDQRPSWGDIRGRDNGEGFGK